MVAASSSFGADNLAPAAAAPAPSTFQKVLSKARSYKALSEQLEARVKLLTARAEAAEKLLAEAGRHDVKREKKLREGVEKLLAETRQEVQRERKLREAAEGRATAAGVERLRFQEEVRQVVVALEGKDKELQAARRRLQEYQEAEALCAEGVEDL